MRRALLAAGLLLGATILYFLCWPVPIEPVSWQAPTDRGLVQPFAANARLRPADAIDLAPHAGPEDATLGLDGYVYATTEDGRIIRISGDRVTEFAVTGGRPLGIATDHDGSLIVANAYLGLQRVDADGRVTSLETVAANSVAIAADGRIFFTEPSRKFKAASLDDTLEASLLAIMEHGAHGRVWVLDAKREEATVIVEGLTYANGIALGAGDAFLLFVETAAYRVHKLWLSGPQAGTREVLLDNLPGFPDNLKRGLQGRFWLGLVAPRKAVVDRSADKPWLRKLMQRLPAFARPAADLASHVVAFDAAGEILMSLQDPEARYPMLTGVLETESRLYLTTLHGTALPRIDKRDL